MKGAVILDGAVITSTQAAIDKGVNSLTHGGPIITTDITNTSKLDASAVGGTLGVGSMLGSTTAGFGSKSQDATSITTAGVSGIAGNTSVRTGDAQTGLAPPESVASVLADVNAQVQITSAFKTQAYTAVSTYMSDQRGLLQQQAKNATTNEEKAAIQARLSDLNIEERVLNVLIGLATGAGGVAITKEALGAAADEMRTLMVQDSMKFGGVTDGTTLLSNVSGPSAGVDGDGMKIGGVRVDLDTLCGAGNRRCVTSADGTLKLNEFGQVMFNPEAAGMSLAQFLQSPDAKPMVGPTGGIQGAKGTLFGVPYEAGSWQDRLIEAFSGTHDMIGGSLTGLYDEQGNIKRGQSDLEKILHDRGAEIAIPVAAPFAAATLLSPEVWQAIANLVKVAR